MCRRLVCFLTQRKARLETARENAWAGASWPCIAVDKDVNTARKLLTASPALISWVRPATVLRRWRVYSDTLCSHTRWQHGTQNDGGMAEAVPLIPVA
jgi:hypothetical protein